MEAEPFGLILVDEVLEALNAGEIIEEYSDDQPYPSCLILGRNLTNRPLHIVCAPVIAERRLIVITTYQPDPARWQAEETFMKCVICKSGDVIQAPVQTELKVGYDHLMVTVQAEACAECGEAYYSPETLRRIEQIREEFAGKKIAPPSVGKVYQIS